MDYQHIISLSPKDLYDQGLIFKLKQDYNNYCMYMVMAANYDYDLAIQELFNDYQNNCHNSFLHKKQDLKVTKPFYEMTQQYSYSLNYLGYILNNDNSLEYYEKAGQIMKNPVAQCNLGCHYEKQKDYDKAIMFFELSLEQGFGNSALMLGNIYQNKSEYELACKYYELALTKGCIQAYSHLGGMYYLGLFYKQDYEKAAELFEMGHLKGDMSSTVHLCDCYYDGRGRKQDYNKSRELAELIYKTNNNSIFAIEILGFMYMNAQGVSCDWDRAKEFFELGVTKNSTICMLKLAYILSEPGGTYKVDYEKAIQLYESVLTISTGVQSVHNIHNKSDKISAYLSLANAYSRGLGVNPDKDKMLEYYELAINEGSEEATYALGKLYYMGSDCFSKVKIDKDYEKARKLFESIPEKGATFLADIYYDGKGVEKDIRKAMYLYEQGILEKGYGFMDMSNLVNIYKKLGEQEVSKEHVLAFLNSVNELKRLRDIYGYSEEDIKVIQDCYKLKKENKILIELISALPGGKERLELIKGIESVINNNQDLKNIVIELPGGQDQLELVQKELADEEEKSKNDKCLIC